MQGRENLHATDPKDKRSVLVDGKPALEYDHLRTGELAWILGRRFKTPAPDNIDGNLTVPQSYAHRAHGGIGNGVDRMQRLASTKWVEALVKDKMGSTRIDLHKVLVASPYTKMVSDEVNMFNVYLEGSTLLDVPDVTWWHSQITEDKDTYKGVGFTEGDVNSGRRLQGISVMETGPFLRGIQVNDNIVRFKKVPGLFDDIDLPRNMGDDLAFAVLEAEMRRKNIMDWSPDGIVLSKLESPTDEPMKSVEMDARSAQLFNVGIQGPTVSTSWTSDVRDHKLEVQPMDKVFICLVATMSYTVDTKLDEKREALRTRQATVFADIKDLRKAVEDNTKSQADFLSGVKGFIGELKTLGEEKVESAKELGDTPFIDVKKQYNDMPDKTSNAAIGLKANLDSWLKSMDKLTPEEMADLLQKQTELRKGTKNVSMAVLTDFRLIRSTSSHMINYSYPKPGAINSRMGLKIGAVRSDPSKPTEYFGAAEYVVGAWCIGTVTDSAASRSTVGNLVKTAPTSMAINVNVNVQWWSADRLYKHYMDKQNLTEMRGFKKRAAPPEENADVDVTIEKQAEATPPEENADVDVTIAANPLSNDMSAAAVADRTAKRQKGASNSGIDGGAGIGASEAASARPSSLRRA
jgi:hypothetical protein